mgnify:CR=1 FL=1
MSLWILLNRKVCTPRPDPLPVEEEDPLLAEEEAGCTVAAESASYLLFVLQAAAESL